MSQESAQHDPVKRASAQSHAYRARNHDAAAAQGVERSQAAQRRRDSATQLIVPQVPATHHIYVRQRSLAHVQCMYARVLDARGGRTSSQAQTGCLVTPGWCRSAGWLAATCAINPVECRVRVSAVPRTRNACMHARVLDAAGAQRIECSQAAQWADASLLRKTARPRTR